MNLATEHQVELNRYLSHFRSKKDGVLKELDQILTEFRQDNVVDSIFNREDVTHICTQFSLNKVLIHNI